MTIFHANIVIEPPKGSAQATFAQDAYDEMIKLLVTKGCAAVGSFHAAPDKGCGCNILDPKSLREAVERGIQILEERGQVPPQQKP